MQIVYATYPWAFETPGGGEIQLLKYEQYLLKAGADVVRYDPWRSGLDKAELFHFFSCMGGSVHLCNYVKARGIPLVISASLWLTEETMHLYPIAEITAQLSLADAIVTNGDVESDRISTILGLSRERFQTVRNACDPWFGEPVDPRLFRSAYEIHGPFVLNVGNIEPRKNQLALIRAAKQAGKPLILLGHIRDAEYGEACLAEAGPNVRHLGALDHDSPLLRSAYAACEVFCLPSTLETPGLAALEASAAGARLVITGEGSTREYFGDHALYVNSDDVEGIATALRKAGETPPSEQLRHYVNKNFTWNHAVEPLLELYHRLAAAR
ncbi:group 1 glycosyl transferase [Rhizobium sp. NBRC 114257]|uniref:Group 1 glycosyl transferase n=1 Tax=Rhizobium dioscoreae TaxID=2653122 RepID=A0ABQ0ZA57_9HYPH|nr:MULTISPECIES: glycosyltransferase [Rhizobium]GES52436.1 group 1 glycosyl transferase [Rhizobium dioscoreae]GLU83762.1 group 1 glycosyl transferase [Rhizobium sp. NBRC 114257]